MKKLLFTALNKLIMKRILLGLVVLLTGTVSFAQKATLKGKVTDKENGEGLIGASVALLEDNKVVAGVAADLDGNYRIEIEPGTYDLKVQYIGYEEQKVENFDLKAGEIHVKNFLMKASEVTLESITIAKTESVRRVPASIRVGRSDKATTYVDAVSVKDRRRSEPKRDVSEKREERLSKKATSMEVEDFDVADDSYGGSKSLGLMAPTPVVEQSAGTLTAGELNDFAKWNLWQDLSKSELNVYTKNWKISPNRRVSVLVTNTEEYPVVNAKVSIKKGDDLIWTAHTDNTGRAELWISLMQEVKLNMEDVSLHIDADAEHFEVKDLVEMSTGINHVALPLGCNAPYQMDIAFVVDATGSMGDEINYLKAELKDVINSVQKDNAQLQINLGSVFYKDVTDEYVTRMSPLSDNIETTVNFIAEQYASGGGDFPEAVDSAVSHAVNGFDWSESARARLMFLILDAPPHNDAESVNRIKAATEKAAAKGIRIIPVVGSGIDKSTEYLMRSMALATNGSYVFLTDHSGVGGSHIKPSTDEYEVTYLNGLLKEVISRYTDVVECHEDPKTPKDLASTNRNVIDHVITNEGKLGLDKEEKTVIKNKVILANGEAVKPAEKPDNHFKETLTEKGVAVYPNPTLGPANIQFKQKVEEIFLADANGKFLRRYNTQNLDYFTIDISEFPGGTYFVAYMDNDQLKSEKLILRK